MVQSQLLSLASLQALSHTCRTNSQRQRNGEASHILEHLPAKEPDNVSQGLEEPKTKLKKGLILDFYMPCDQRQRLQMNANIAPCLLHGSIGNYLLMHSP